MGRDTSSEGILSTSQSVLSSLPLKREVPMDQAGRVLYRFISSPKEKAYLPIHVDCTSMHNDGNRPDIQQAYNRLAAGYDREGDTKPANAYLERPAIRSLLPDVANARILDAGCGAGHLTCELVERGANVIGLDTSREMLRYARDRAQNASFLQADLGNDLPFGADTFDGVASSLAFHYVHEWASLFENLRRVLKPRGWVVFSVQHPHADFVEYDESRNYHKIERVSAVWDSFGKQVEVPAYRRPLSEMIAPALDTGFRLDRLIEPTPTEDYRQADPEGYEYEATHPNFLCLRFIACVEDP